MKWSQEEVLAFINIYKEKTVLWDPKAPHHYNRSIKNNAWEEIARATGRSAEECKRKMEYLLSALRREKLKMRRSVKRKEVGDKVYKSVWFAFDGLKFLLSKRTSRRAQNAVEDETLNEAAENSDGEEDNPNRETTCRQTVSTVHISRAKRKSPKERKSFDKSAEIPQTGNQVLQDDCQHFGNWIAAKLRKFNDDERTYLESEIIAVFSKANNYSSLKA